MTRFSFGLSCSRRRQPQLLTAAIVAELVLLTCTGCGHSDLGTVSGKVTLDGAPLPEAFVEFVPTTGQGSTSSGRTDADGEYDLMFSRSVRGASPGKSTVRITTRDVVAGKDGRDEWLPEKVPARYNAKSELSEDVQTGTNRFDFDLQSDK